MLLIKQNSNCVGGATQKQLGWVEKVRDRGEQIAKSFFRRRGDHSYIQSLKNVALEMDKKSSLNKAHIFIGLSIAIILVACYFSFPEFKQGIDEAFDVLTGEDEGRLKEWVSRFGIFGPVVIILGMMVQMFLIVVPNFLLIMIAIVSYGAVWGSVIALIGAFAASTLGYYIGGKLTPVTLHKFISTANQEKVGEFIKDYGIATVMICRLCSFSNDAISFVTGILKMNYRKYILSSLTGITPLIVTLAIFGKNDKIEWALLWIAGASLVVLFIYIILDRRRKRRREMKSTEKPNP